jgi:hypothetical protein
VRVRRELWFNVDIDDYFYKLHDWLDKRGIEHEFYILIHPKLDWLYRLAIKLPICQPHNWLLRFVFHISDWIIGRDRLLVKVILDGG